MFEIIKDSNEIDQINVCMVCARVKFQWITWIYVFKHKVYRLYQNSSIKIFQKLNLANVWMETGWQSMHKQGEQPSFFISKGKEFQTEIVLWIK